MADQSPSCESPRNKERIMDIADIIAMDIADIIATINAWGADPTEAVQSAYGTVRAIPAAPAPYALTVTHTFSPELARQARSE